MIPCICINDKNKPKEIPDNRWVKEGEEYNIIYATYSIPSKTLGFYLHELELNESCEPYEFYKSNRFAVSEENLERLIDFIRDCNETAFSVSDLMKEILLERDVVSGK